jgi:hypothetical protein
LGSAIRCKLRHWRKLTLCLHQAVHPLDNNLCQRALKKAVGHGKNVVPSASHRAPILPIAALAMLRDGSKTI